MISRQTGQEVYVYACISMSCHMCILTYHFLVSLTNCPPQSDEHTSNYWLCSQPWQIVLSKWSLACHFDSQTLPSYNCPCTPQFSHAPPSQHEELMCQVSARYRRMSLNNRICWRMMSRPHCSLIPTLDFITPCTVHWIFCNCSSPWWSHDFYALSRFPILTIKFWPYMVRVVKAMGYQGISSIKHWWAEIEIALELWRDTQSPWG